MLNEIQIDEFRELTHHAYYIDCGQRYSYYSYKLITHLKKSVLYSYNIDVFLREHKNFNKNLRNLKRYTRLTFNSYNDWIIAKKESIDALESFQEFVKQIIDSYSSKNYSYDLERQTFENWDWKNRGLLNLQTVALFLGNYDEAYHHYDEALNSALKLHNRSYYNNMINELIVARNNMFVGEKLYRELSVPSFDCDDVNELKYKLPHSE